MGDGPVTRERKRAASAVKPVAPAVDKKETAKRGASIADATPAAGKRISTGERKPKRAKAAASQDASTQPLDGTEQAEPSQSEPTPPAPSRPAGAADVEMVCDVPYGTSEKGVLKVVSWNVCSFRSIIKSGALQAYLKLEMPDVACFQETKLHDAIVAADDFVQFEDYDIHWHHCVVKKGYSGVATFVRKDLATRKGVSVEAIVPGIGEDESDREGRIQTISLSCGIAIVNAYVPNSGSKLARLQYRTEKFEPAMREFLQECASKHTAGVLYCGDLNVAHHPIDIHNSKGNLKSAGHTPAERAEFSKLLEAGWVDILRELYPEKRAYTYFSKRFGPRMKAERKGWRLDMFVANQKAFERVLDSFIRYEENGSDHCPVAVKLRI